MFKAIIHITGDLLYTVAFSLFFEILVVFLSNVVL